MIQESYQDHHQRVIQQQQLQPQQQHVQKQQHQDQKHNYRPQEELESEKQYRKPAASITKHIIPIMVVGAQPQTSQRHSKLNEKIYHQSLDSGKSKKLADSCSALIRHQPIIPQRQVTFQHINQPQQVEKKFNYRSIRQRPRHQQHIPIMKEIQRQECNEDYYPSNSNAIKSTNSLRLSFNARNIDIPLKAVLKIKYRNSSLNDKIRPMDEMTSSSKSSKKSSIYGNHYRYSCTSKNKIDLHKCNKSYRTNFNKLKPDCRLCLAFLRYLSDQDKNDFREICNSNNIEICD